MNTMCSDQTLITDDSDRFPKKIVRGVLVVSFETELHESVLQKAQIHILETLTNQSLKGLILDLSLVEYLDSYSAHIIENTATTADLLGKRTIIVGISAELAGTLVEFDVALKRTLIAVNLDQALNLLGATDV